MTSRYSASQTIIELDDKYAASVALCAIGFYTAYTSYQNESYHVCVLAVFCTLIRFFALTRVFIADFKRICPSWGSWREGGKFLVTYPVVQFGLIFAFGMTLFGFAK